MGLRAMSSGLKETLSLAVDLMQTYGGLVFFFLAMKCLLGLLSFSFLYHLFVLLSLFFLDFRVWHLGRQCQEIHKFVRCLKNLSDNLRNGLCSGDVGCATCCSRIQSRRACLCDRFNENKDSIAEKIPCCKMRSKNCNHGNEVVKLEESEEKQGNEKEEEAEEERVYGDGEDGIIKLMRELAKERELRAATMLELEKERKAASSAADEAMAKILWLQNEKAFIERESRQYRAMAEQKQLYDQEVIQALQWIISSLEAERVEDKPIELHSRGAKTIESGAENLLDCGL